MSTFHWRTLNEHFFTQQSAGWIEFRKKVKLKGTSDLDLLPPVCSGCELAAWQCCPQLRRFWFYTRWKQFAWTRKIWELDNSGFSQRASFVAAWGGANYWPAVWWGQREKLVFWLFSLDFKTSCPNSGRCNEMKTDTLEHKPAGKSFLFSQNVFVLWFS